VSVPRPDPSNLVAFPAAPSHGDRQSPDRPLAEATPRPVPPKGASRDALLLALLGVLNESVDTDSAP
jgi:hypothetical protein